MPLLVACPCGEELRMPSGRAGKIVRCRECKSRIRVPVPTPDDIANPPIRLCAILIEAAPPSAEETEIQREFADASEDAKDSNESANSSPIQDAATTAGNIASETKFESKPRPPAPPKSFEQPVVKNKSAAVGESASVEKPMASGSKANGSKAKSSKSKKRREKKNKAASKNTEIRSKESKNKPSGSTPILVPLEMQEEVPTVVPRDSHLQEIESDEEALQLDQNLYYDAPGVSLNLKRDQFGDDPQEKSSLDDIEGDSEPEKFAQPVIDIRAVPQQQGESRIHQRVKSAQDDRIVLARFFAICLCGIAIVNVVPAVYFWQQWSELPGGYSAGSYEPTLPRWMYLQIFIAAIHVMYAVFLAQIPDWASMRAVSIAMLAVAMIFGLVSTGILIGGAEGIVAKFLALGDLALVRQASIWCVAMLCLATLMSYLGGRESARWQRAEQLMAEIGN